MKRALVAVVAGGTALAATAVLSKAPQLVDATWGRVIGPWTTFTLSRLTDLAPFALIEALFAIWLAMRLVQAARACRDVVRRQRRLAPALGGAALAFLRDVGVATFFFYALWGVGYAQAPLERRLGWEVRGAAASTDGDAEELARLAEQMVVAANDAYVALHGSEDAGAPTRLGSLAALDAAVERGWHEAATALDLPAASALRHGRAKGLLISPLLRRAGLSGFYCPFTGEANVNDTVPAVAMPQVIAHEKAHQRAVNREDEANFLGWCAAAAAPDPLVRYSAAVFAQRQLLRALIAVDAARARTLVERRVPGVQRDVDDLRAYWRVSEGRTGKIAERMNDAYLRSNRVTEGVASYGRSVELLLSWARLHGGSLEAPVRAGPPDVGSVSSAPRTLRASASSVNGFCRKSASETESPWRTIASSL
jgi:hypothetical protein